MNSLASIIYILASGLLAGWLSARAFPRSSSNDRVSGALSWLVFFFAAFWGGFYLLGYIELVTNLKVVSPVFAAVVMLFALTGCRLWLKQSAPRPSTHAEKTDSDRDSLLAILRSCSKTSRIVLFAAVLTFALASLMLVVGFPRGYEPNAYHLPIGLHIFQAHSLKVWDTVYLHTFTANASIYFGFLLGVFSEHLVAAAGVVFLIPLVLAVYGLGMLTGADRTASLLASLGVLTIPLVAFSAFEADADVGGIAFLAAAVYFVLSKSNLPLAHQVLGGLSAGLAYGFKNLHLVGVCFLFLLVLFQAWRNSRNHFGMRRLSSIARPAALFALSTLAMASFWLARSYVQLGNPLYPVNLPVFERIGWAQAPDIDYRERAATQFEWVRSPMEWSVYPWVEWHYAKENFKSSSGLGAFFGLVPVACLASALALFRRQRRGRHVVASLLAGGCFVILCWWILNVRQPRYFMASFVFLIPLVALTLNLATGRHRKVFELMAGFSICIMLMIVFSSQLVEFGARFIHGHQFTRHAFYVYPSIIDSLPPNSTIVNFGRRTADYALFGKNHRNRVVNYLEAYRWMGADPDGWIPEEAPEEGTLSLFTLRRLRATHLFTVGYPRLSLDTSVSLQELDRIDTDPVSKHPLQKPLIVYQINYADTQYAKHR